MLDIWMYIYEFMYMYMSLVHVRDVKSHVTTVTGSHLNMASSQISHDLWWFRKCIFLGNPLVKRMGKYGVNGIYIYIHFPNL